MFTLLECVGAGAIPPDYEESIALSQAYRGAKSDGALSCVDDVIQVPPRGYISDSEVATRADPPAGGSKPTSPNGPASENWILVNRDAEGTTVASRPVSPVQTLVYPCRLMRHSTFALVKCWDSLAFIIRNVAVGHITPFNFERYVKCIRTFVEASLNGGNYISRGQRDAARHPGAWHASKASSTRRSRKDLNAATSGPAAASHGESGDESDDDELLQRYDTIAIQLLDLMHTLHTRTAQIFHWWAAEVGSLPQCSDLWSRGWCPILQGIARLATDQRRQVRTSAITCLQRALLVHDLQTLTGPEWESCFRQVLFPLLYELLAEVPSHQIDATLLEESRMRTATIMSKVFLHHLTPLIPLPTFNELWLEILDYIEKFMNAGSDLLHEAMLESLKNMLLVMHSVRNTERLTLPVYRLIFEFHLVRLQVRVFHTNNGELWTLTWSRIGKFLPSLKKELFDKDPSECPFPRPF